MIAKAIVAIAAFAACRVADLDVSGKPCPCPSDYVCNAGVCAHAITSDAQHGDAPRDGIIDGVPAQSCLSVPPKTSLSYATFNFGDFGTAWSTVGGGSWTVNAQGDVIQSSATAQVAIAETAPATNDYRLVSTFHATSTGNGQAIELAARIEINLAIAPPKQHVYHCNWEPSDGAFMIQRDDSPTVGTTLNIVTVDTSTIAGYTTSTPITMEFQVTGNTLACCIENFPANASIVASDTTYTVGQAGLKTYEMSAVYNNFQIFK